MSGSYAENFYSSPEKAFRRLVDVYRVPLADASDVMVAALADKRVWKDVKDSGGRVGVKFKGEGRWIVRVRRGSRPPQEKGPSGAGPSR